MVIAKVPNSLATLVFLASDWLNCSESPLSTMKGHQGRVCRVAFHPSGNYVASASFDTTWRLWDVTTSKELLLQEGHSKEVYAVEFQNDGALVASGYGSILTSFLPAYSPFSGLDSVGRVWDLRTGRSAMVLDGHVQALFAMSFSPNGFGCPSQFLKSLTYLFSSYQIATGAADDTIRIWDMRSLKSLYTIPAHLSNVSDIRFFHANDKFFKQPPPTDVEMDGPDGDVSHDTDKEKDAAWEEWRYRSGLFFASSGYDGFIKLWSADDWQLLRSLPTDGGKVMSVDISSDGDMIASGTYNRNFQLFAPEEV